MKTGIGIVLVGVLAGCATGATVEQRSEAVVVGDARELYDSGGCVELYASDLDLVEAPVAGLAGLVAVLAGDDALCVRDADELRFAGGADPRFEDDFGPLGGLGVPTSRTDTQPDPQPDQPETDPDSQPDPQPDSPEDVRGAHF
jgi:hypothetical protein